MAYHLKVISASDATNLNNAITLVNTALAADLVTFGDQNVQANNISTSANDTGPVFIAAVLVQEAG